MTIEDTTDLPEGTILYIDAPPQMYEWSDVVMIIGEGSNSVESDYKVLRLNTGEVVDNYVIQHNDHLLPS